ncbi:MAG: hypothetical protein ACRDBL_06140 [Rhabdaerophilum sp.]
MILTAVIAILFSLPVDAQRRPPLPLVQKPPIESPEGIVLRILASYRDGNPVALEAMPLVPRLQDALRRTDLATDPIAEPDRPVSRLAIDMAETMGDKRVSVAARFSYGRDERLIHFDLDVTSGDWLITNMRPRGGPSLRQLLRINR